MSEFFGFFLVVMVVVAIAIKWVFFGVIFKKNESEDADLFKLWIFFLGLIAVVISAFLANFSNHEISESTEQWGQMGDFFGGMLNPILAFASFIALLYTIQIQSKGLKNTAEAQQKSMDALSRQNFENTFFKLLDSVKKASDDFLFNDKQCSYICHPNGNYSKDILFVADEASLNYEFPENEDNPDPEFSDWKIAKEKIIDVHKNFDRLVMLCYHMLEYLLESGQYPKKGERDTFLCDFQSLYVNLLLAMLDKNQLKMMLIFCAKDDDYQRVRHVFDFYHFFYRTEIDFDSNVGKGLKVSESGFTKKAFTKDLN